MIAKEEPAKFIKKANTKKSKPFSQPIKLQQSFEPQTKRLQKFIKVSEQNNSFLIDKKQLKNFVVIGRVKKQIFCIYHPILKLYGSVDQHAMHERVRYQFYINSLQNSNINSFITRNIEKNGKITPKQTLSSKSEKKLLFVGKNEIKIQPGQINKWGMKILIDQANSVYLLDNCQILGKVLEDHQLIIIVRQILQLQFNQSNNIPQTLDSIIAEHSCKSAIKFGDEISQQWCKDLIFNASLCFFPWQCVHGRPSVHFQWHTSQESRNYAID